MGQIKSEEGKTLSAKALLTLTALGVVYGDIGTSPLYVMKESFLHNHFGINEVNVYGILSLVFWSLIIVISIKYLGLLLKADNRGEGGILALTGLVTPENERLQSKRKNEKDDIQKVKDYIKEYDAGLLILGNPINMDGTKGTRALITEEFYDKLNEELEIEIKLWVSPS